MRLRAPFRHALTDKDIATMRQVVALIAIIIFATPVAISVATAFAFCVAATLLHRAAKAMRAPRLNYLSQAQWEAERERADHPRKTRELAQLRQLRDRGVSTMYDDFRLAWLEVEINDFPPPLRSRRAIAAQ
jgi:hypothetical protein